MNYRNIDLEICPEDGTWERLKEKLTPDNNLKLIEKAFSFAKERHKEQKRKSGEEFIIHPGWIARVVAQLEIGDEAIMAALLHDTVEDTSTTMEELAKEFGDEVALLVTGLTDIKNKTEEFIVHEENIEVFKNFLFSSVNDVRVLIIRIVDKLHNGITIDHLPIDKKIKYAKRVMSIYAPVAEYVGLHFFKQKLEDIAFKILQPEEYVKIEKELESRLLGEKKLLARISLSVEQILKTNNIFNYNLQGRIKSVYSTYRKIISKGHYLDRVGIRILLSSVEDCYLVLALLHAKYKFIPEELNDYIANPKPNGYRSIQTTLTAEGGVTLEVQIRTFEMHEFNEFGPASHIAYKYGKDSAKGMEWVKDLLAWEKDKDKENVNKYKVGVLQNYVYVFTPKSDVIQIPKGSTAIDFAYAIHSGLGDCYQGALVNKKMVKMSHELKTGDLVEILVGNKVNCSPDWLDIAKTSKAKERIRKMLGLTVNN